MNSAAYPALWRSSTEAARSCQRWYFVWVRAHLSLLAATGLLAAWSPSGDAPAIVPAVPPDQAGAVLARLVEAQQRAAGIDHVVSGVIAGMMFAALLIGLVLQLRPMDQAWFRARAFAENAKGAAWRFMMKPQPAQPDEVEADERTFLEELQRIRGRFPQVEVQLSAHDAGGGEITAEMRDVRSRELLKRLALYKEHRLQDQIDWYRGKAKSNADDETRWFVVVLVAEGLAVVAGVVRILSLHDYNPTGAIAAIAACLVAWRQAKRFGELANTYGVACRDLNGLLTKADHVHDETHLATLVDEVESAISREHRLWVDLRSSAS